MALEFGLHSNHSKNQQKDVNIRVPFDTVRHSNADRMITVRLRSSDSSGIRIRLCSIGYAWILACQQGPTLPQLLVIFILKSLNNNLYNKGIIYLKFSTSCDKILSTVC